MRTSGRAGAVFLFAVLALTLGTAGPASAHAEVTSSSPAAGAVLTACPQTVSLTFDEAVATRGLAVTVQGRPEAVTEHADARHFSVALDGCRPGGQAIAWRSVSADDGHVATGTIHFRVMASATTDARAPMAKHAVLGFSSASMFWTATFRSIQYAALAIFGGGLFFLSVIWPRGAGVRRARGLLLGAVIGGLLSAIGALAATIWQTGMTTGLALQQPFGREYSAMALLWVLAAVVVIELLQRGPIAVSRLSWRISAALLGLGMAALAAMSAHAYSSEHRVLGLIADVTHVTAMSLWIGGLLMLTLVFVPRREDDDVRRVVRRFSRVAQLSVGAVVVSGLGLLAIVVLPLPTFWGTHFATVLLIKLSILAIALAAALLSKRWAKRHAATPSSGTLPPVRVLALTLAVETLGALGVLAAAGTLVTSSPGT